MAIAPRANFADTLALWLAKTFGSARTPRRSAWDLSVKADPVGSMVVSSYGLAQPVRTPRRFDKLADEGYNQNAPVFHAINLIAGGCAGIPWVLYERKGANRRGAEIDQHPLLDLMQRPNPTQGWGKFFEAYVAYLYIAGNSYLWANRPKKSGAPLELWTLRPDRMRIIPDAKQFVGGYTYEINGQRLDFDARSVLHTKTFAPLDDWYGMSPLVVAARNIDIRNAGGDWNLALLQNSGRTPGFFVSKERMGDVQFQRMREQLIDRYTGSRNVGLPGLLEEGVTWVGNGINPQDMDWGGLTLAQTRDIAITIGVPPEMLGDPTVKTYASYSEARASFYTETVLPLMDVLRDELNRWLTPMYGANLWLDYNTEEIEALAPLRAARWEQVQAATFLTVNEKREATGYGKVPDGDVIILPAESATLQEIIAGDTGASAGGQSGTGDSNVTQSADDDDTTTQPPNEGSDTDEGAPTPAPDADTPGNAGNAASGADSPGGRGMPDGGMASAVDSGAKAKRPTKRPVQRYDPLDDLLAGKVIRLRPKASMPDREEKTAAVAAAGRRA